MNENTFKHLFTNLDFESVEADRDVFFESLVSYDLLSDSQKKAFENEYILTFFRRFADADGYEYVMKNLPYFKVKQFAKEIDITPSFVRVTNSRGQTFTLLKLSEVFPELLDKLPNLENEKRTGMCHYGSMMLATICEEKTLKLVTGYISGKSEKSKYLHTWTQFTAFGKPYVMDYTLNLLMKREEYFSLLGVKEVLCTITRQQYLEDRKLFDKYDIIKGLGSKGYLTFRHEVMREYQKLDNLEKK